MRKTGHSDYCRSKYDAIGCYCEPNESDCLSCGLPKKMCRTDDPTRTKLCGNRRCKDFKK